MVEVELGMRGFTRTGHPERHRAAYLRGERLKSKLLVSEIRPKRMSREEFPGYIPLGFIFSEFDLLGEIRR